MCWQNNHNHNKDGNTVIEWFDIGEYPRSRQQSKHEYVTTRNEQGLSTVKN